jgi:hypothetical protein
VGSWNWLLVQGNKVFPGVFDHYAARTAWSAQQMTDELVGERDGNLDKALDDDPGTDRGPSGRFGDRAGGVLDRNFLRSLGQVGRDVATSIRDRVRELRSPDHR